MFHHKLRIIVAAGGGGACYTNGTDGISYDYRGGHGGKTEGITFNTVTKGGQKNSGSFFIGKEGLTRDDSNPNIKGGSTGGGGGGYYGGDVLSLDEVSTIYGLEAGGAGGSSYISGYPDCDSVKLYPSDKIEHSGNPQHYSSLIFRNFKINSGDEEFKKPMSLEIEKGHSGNGAITITFLYPQAITCKESSFTFCISFLYFLIIISISK